MVSRERSSGGVLDDVSKAIIEQLQQDGRRPYATIGRAVGLSEAAVRQRVQRLQDSGVIQVVAVTDPMQLGMARTAMVGIRITGDLDAPATRLESMPEISYLVACAGSFDLLAEVVARDDDHLLDVHRTIRTTPGVATAEIFMYLHLRKQTYTWGAR